MSDARTAILNAIRRSQASGADVASVEMDVQQYMHRHQCGPQPQWPGDDVTRFISKVEAAAGTHASVTDTRAIVEEVLAVMAENALPAQLTRASTPLLESLTWPENLHVKSGPAQSGDTTVVTEAFAAVAETGSLVLRAGAETPVTQNFLPDNFICIVHDQCILRHIEDVWQRLRNTTQTMPRAVNFITGPSRTADVEQTIQLGAHGPRRLHVILLRGQF